MRHEHYLGMHDCVGRPLLEGEHSLYRCWAVGLRRRVGQSLQAAPTLPVEAGCLSLPGIGTHCRSLWRVGGVSEEFLNKRRRRALQENRPAPRLKARLLRGQKRRCVLVADQRAPQRLPSTYRPLRGRRRVRSGAGGQGAGRMRASANGASNAYRCASRAMTAACSGAFVGPAFSASRARTAWRRRGCGVAAGCGTGADKRTGGKGEADR